MAEGSVGPGASGSEEDRGPHGKVVFDRELALHRVGDDEELLRVVARIFVDQAPRRVEALVRAASALDLKAVEDLAHALKSSASALALQEVSRICAELEERGARAAAAGCDSLAADLEVALAAGVDALTRSVLPE